MIYYYMNDINDDKYDNYVISYGLFQDNTIFYNSNLGKIVSIQLLIQLLIFHYYYYHYKCVLFLVLFSYCLHF